MLHVDIQYLILASGRLRNFKQKAPTLWVASCNICGDSKTHQKKARLYFFRHNHNNLLVCKCYNCGLNTSFDRWLQGTDPVLHKDYTYAKYLYERPLETIQEGFERLVMQDAKNATEPHYRPKELSIPTIDALPAGHYAKAYIASRKIPEQFWKELYYTDNYKAFCDRDFPNHGKENLPEDDRIVIPFINRDNYITLVSGRSIETRSSLRYVTVKILDEKKIYGLNRLNYEKPVYVVEGPLDSCFINNCVASGDSNLVGAADYLITLGIKNLILLFDSEPYNLQIVEQIENAIGCGYKVIILPYDDNAKDLNQLVMNGMSLEKLKRYVDEHIYQGLDATLKLVEWRKVK